MSEMINHLPIFMRKSKVFLELFNAEEQELYQLNVAREDLLSQLSVDTATWGLDIYEKELKIKTDKTKTFEERRSVIKSKWRGFGKADSKLIQLVAESFMNGQVEVRYENPNGEPNPPYSIIVKFIGTRGVPTNLEDLQNLIEEIKPAHKGIEFEFTYITWNELERGTFTWNDIDLMILTRNEFETLKVE
ncbi:DUF2313 domain-containing protein [Chengkuizengella sp. YPA3-1-1]|uniref:DUF2313 domain-containing protein n=2 Tax=Chengkuizengella marina TaxID=2507566 RepID=A0A6N9Q7Q3_9BACL|nr:DUF2313 domain-containing protein [Chengkuizengella marina]